MHIIHILYISSHISLISTGATIAPTVTKDTTLLIISDADLHISTPSSKLTKARKLGIKIMPESQWVKLVQKYIKIVNGQ